MKSLDNVYIRTYNFSLDFEWDPKKAASNLAKHAVRFADAVEIFEDPRAVTIRDADFEEEERWLVIGMDVFARLLVVAYTWRGERIRIISARKASKREQLQYEELQ